jgi:NAD(P)H-flavin reductase
MKLGEGKPGFYAIASPPDGRNVLSFLIKESESNQFLTKLVENKDVVEMSVPQGKGFQYAD